MQPISSHRENFYNTADKKNAVKTTAANIPIDSFSPADSIDNTPKKSTNLLLKLLDVRVPTTARLFPPEERDKVLDLLQPGDIILETNDAYPGWQLLEKVVFNSDFTHAAIYEGDGKFIEATTGDPSGKGVIRSDLKEYLEGRINLEIIRPPYKTPEDRDAAIDYARSQLGKPYDGAFNQEDDSEHYCAELVQRALTSMPNPIDVEITNFFGKKAVGPNAFQKINGAEVVYTTKSNFYKSALKRYPVLLGAAGFAAAGALALGPVGAAAGFAGGTLLSIMTGNKIQAGQFSLSPK